MPTCADICVIGAGPTGLAFAVALKQRLPDRDIVVLDRGDARIDDGKSVAFGPRARNFLQKLDAWPNREKPILRAEISFAPTPTLPPTPPFPSLSSLLPPVFSPAADGGFFASCFRPLELRGANDSALAFIAPHEEVRDALFSQVADNVQSPATVLGLRDAGEFAEVQLRDAKPIRAKLAVLACAFSPPPAGFAARDFDYGQCAITLSGKVENNDGGWDDATAFERFSPNGILTLVPRQTGEDELGAVICAGAAAGAEWNGLSDADLSARLTAAFPRLGFGVRIAGVRRVYAPQLRRVFPQGRGRIVCIGQGATIVHPIGAQGLNLALRDANALAETLADAESGAALEKSDGDFGAMFARRRRREHFAIAMTTHSLAMLARRRAFPLRAAGGLFCALAAAEQAAPLRQRMAERMGKNY